MRRLRFRFMARVALLVALIAVMAWPSPAQAHTDLLRASPGPAQAVGGTVDFIDLVFLESVTQFDVQVTGPEGERISGGLNTTSGQLFRFEMDELTSPGRYTVNYTMISADSDFTDVRYIFEYNPDAPQPLPLGDVDVPETGTSLVTILAGVIFVASVIGLAMVFLTGLERKRANAASPDPVTDR